MHSAVLKEHKYDEAELQTQIHSLLVKPATVPEVERVRNVFTCENRLTKLIYISRSPS